MLNRFKNAIYGQSSSDDSSIDSSYVAESTISKRIRSALTRSTSFREDLLGENSKNRSETTIERGSDDDDCDIAGQRGKNQLPKRPTNSSDEYRSNRDQVRREKNGETSGIKVPKFHYTRPEFLQLKTDDEIIVSADHRIRPIILPRDASRLPWKSGYAECINAGKSLKNEDQASCYQDVAIRQNTMTSSIIDQIPWTYFGLFDGHAGTAVSIAAASQLHNLISEKIRQVADLLISYEFGLDDLSDDSDESSDFSDCSSSLSNSPASKETQNIPKIAATTVTTATTETTETATPTKDAERSETEPQVNKLDTIFEDSDSVNEATNQFEHVLEKTIKSIEISNMLSNGDKTSPGDKVSEEENNQQFSNEHADQDHDENDRDNKGKSSTTVTTKNGETSYIKCYEPSCHLKLMPNLGDGICVESLISGALESAFWEMDKIIATDKHDYKMAGGCTAIVGLFILGKLYVCNAGDSRAIVVRKDGQVKPMSFDHTPISERQRILRLALERPEFLGNEFTRLQFIRKPTRKDLGKQMLHRDAYMTGWSPKTITYDDLKFPLVWGQGKRSRVLATIGVTRGFGDHELRAQLGSVPIKPFLTPEPAIIVLDLEKKNQDGNENQEEEEEELSADDVLVMGTDGLWDVTSNQEAADIVKRSFELFRDSEDTRLKYRYTMAAQDLVIHSRGYSSQWTGSVWRTHDDRFASLDDICAFVVPLKAYRDEYLEWKKLRMDYVRSKRQSRLNKLMRQV